MASARDSVILEILTETKGSIGDMKSLVTAIAGVAAAYKTVQQVAKQAIESFELAAGFNQQEMAFENLTATAGASASQLLASLKDMSKGTISELDLMRSASQANLLGVGFQEMPKLLEIARASALATGQDMSFMFESITTGIARESPMILDNLGIKVKLAEVTAEYAAALGKSAEQLSKAERQQALMNAVVESGQQSIDRMGDAMDEMTDIEAWTALKVAAEEFSTELGQNLVATLGNSMRAIGKFLADITSALSGGRQQNAALETAAKTADLTKLSFIELTRMTELLQTGLDAARENYVFTLGLFEDKSPALFDSTYGDNAQKNIDAMIEALNRLHPALAVVTEEWNAQLASVEAARAATDAAGGAAEGLVSKVSLEDVRHFAEETRGLLAATTGLGPQIVDIFGVMPELFAEAAVEIENVTTKMDRLDKAGKFPEATTGAKEFAAVLGELDGIAVDLFTGFAMEGMFEFGKVIGDASTGADALANAFSRMIDDFAGQIQKLLLRAGLEAIATGTEPMKWVGLGLVIASGLVAIGRGIDAGKRAADGQVGNIDALVPSSSDSRGRSTRSRQAGAGPQQGDGTIIINNTVIQGSLMANKDMVAQMQGFGR